jgi:hypothetical protein
MSTQSENASDQSAAFQKIWTESVTKLMQAASAFTPGSASPELLGEIRSGILNALAKSWNEFLRSAEFQEAMKQWMEQAIAFRKMNHDLMAKVRKEMQAPSRDDIDAIMLSMRHMETRILDRLEELENQLNGSHNATTAARTRPARKRSSRKPRQNVGRRTS